MTKSDSFLDTNEEGQKWPSFTLSEDEFEKCYQVALRLVARREYSSYKLRRKLDEKKFQSDTIEDAITRLTQFNFLNDKRYAEHKIAYYLRKGQSFSNIKNLIAFKHQIQITDLDITQVEKDLGISHVSVIYQLAEKALHKYASKYSGPELPRKIANFLVRRGVDYQQAWDHAQKQAKSNYSSHESAFD